MLKIKNILFIFTFTMLPFFGVGQEEKLADAINYLQKNNLDSAKICIDQAVLNASTSGSYQAWHIKGFVYKSIYKEKEKSNKQSTARVVALEALKKSISLDVEKQVLVQNTQGIKYLTSTLYNDVVSSLDPVDFTIAISNFELFKKYYPIADPNEQVIKQKEIEFQLELGKIYAEMFRQNKQTNKNYFELAKSAYNAVLAIDVNNIGANYHMGILYYNQAVDLINESDYVELKALNEIQDNSILLFQQSLPFMVKAYELNPSNSNTILGLSGIYFGLNDKEKSAEFKQKSEELEKKK